jgi:hypothetical protein
VAYHVLRDQQGETFFIGKGGLEPGLEDLEIKGVHYKEHVLDGIMSSTREYSRPRRMRSC